MYIYIYIYICVYIYIYIGLTARPKRSKQRSALFYRVNHRISSISRAMGARLARCSVDTVGELLSGVSWPLHDIAITNIGG